MPHFHRVVIGAGTSAAVYLSFFPVRLRERVLVIGELEPWAKRGTHYMGQPPHLLMLPQRNPVRRHGFPALRDNVRSPDRNSQNAPQNPFLRSDAYAQQVAEIIGQHFRVNGTVVGVTRPNGGSYNIEILELLRPNSRVRQLVTCTADRVVVASGTGDPRASAVYKREFDQYQDLFVSGDSYCDDRINVRPGVVAVEGSSATAAWAVEKALSKHATTGVVWIARVDNDSRNNTLEKRFGAAFPSGGRNDWILNRTEKVSRLIANVQEGNLVQDRGTRRLLVKFTNGVEVLVDQYVAAIGAGDGGGFLGALRNNLVPIVDTKGHLHVKRDAVLGYRSNDWTLLMVGAASYQLGSKAKYSQSNEYLPRAARPPEGVPTIIATISALTQYLGGGASRWLDINLASFKDLDEHYRNGLASYLAFEIWFGLGGFLRSPYTPKQICQFITDQIIGTRIMKTSPYGVTVEEVQKLHHDLGLLADPTLGYNDRSNNQVVGFTTLRHFLDAYYS